MWKWGKCSWDFGKWDALGESIEHVGLLRFNFGEWRVMIDIILLKKNYMFIRKDGDVNPCHIFIGMSCSTSELAWWMRKGYGIRTYPWVILLWRGCDFDS